MKSSPNTQFLNQFTAYLKQKIGKRLGKSSKTPWMFSKEKDIIVELIENLNPEKCLEWGSGYSTLAFPPTIKNLNYWLSIEHDEKWYSNMKNSQLSNKVELKLLPIDNPTNEDKNFLKYIEYPDAKFDFIFIDGKLRNECLRKSLQLLSSKSIVVLHDANRVNYHKEFSSFKYHILFTDHRSNYAGIWIGSNSITIESVLDVNKHKSIWKKHLFFSKIPRPHLWFKN